MAVYKTCFLPKDTLALTHNNTYVNQHKAYSNISIDWLEFVKETRNVDIHHALTHSEMMVGKYHVDGYYEKDGERIALEFNGCMHHDHACHYDPNHTHPLSKIPNRVLRNRFGDKVETLTKMYGLKVEVMWECEWKRAKLNNPAAVAFMGKDTHPT